MREDEKYSRISKAFLSLPIFTATKRKFINLELDKFYGYSEIFITGLQLTPDLDFRLFAHLLRIAKDERSNIACISFPELNKLGFACDSKSRKAIENSLFKLASITIALKSLSGQRFSTLNILHGEVTPEKSLKVKFTDEFLQLISSEKFIYNLYIPEIEALKTLSAKTLFLHLQSNQLFTDFTHKQLVIRLGLQERAIKNQNRSIEVGLNELLEAGYIQRWSPKISGRNITGYKVFQTDSKTRKNLLSRSSQPIKKIPLKQKKETRKIISSGYNLQSILQQLSEIDIHSLPDEEVITKDKVITIDDEYIDYDYNKEIIQ